MSFRRLCSAGLLGAALFLGVSPPAHANPLDAAGSLPTIGRAAAEQALSDTELPHAAATGSITDPTGDSAAVHDVVGSTLSFDQTNIVATVTLSQPVTINANNWLEVGLSFNNSGDDDAIIIWGQASSTASPTVKGQNQNNEACPATETTSGNTVTFTTPSSCYDTPGSIAQFVLYGDFLSYLNNKDTTAVDIAPDSESLTYASEPGGYWLLGGDGGVFSFGGANFYGSTGNLKLNQPVVAMSGMPANDGYRFAASDGGVFNYGSAQFYGSMGAKPLNKPIAGMATAADGLGYWEVASDGGVFAFGDATFYGSMGGKALNKPIVGIAPTPTGHGYWEVASDGGIFSFGDAAFYGSAGGQHLNQPIVAMSAPAAGGGYRLLAADGGVFAYGSAAFYGSPAPTTNGSATGFAEAGTSAYDIVTATGKVYEYGSTYHFGDLVDLDVKPNKPIVGMAALH